MADNTGHGNTYDPFAKMPDKPVQPAFLVRDTNSVRAVERHRARMAKAGVDISKPGRKEKALRGKAAIAIAFDQQEAVLAALDGTYARRYWADKWQDLYRRWAMSDIFETILANENTASPGRIRRVLGTILLELDPRVDELGRALLMIFRAWQLRRQVVIERRPMSLIPVVGGNTLGSVVSFTPVVQRIAANKWRVGWPGDSITPRIIEGTDVRAAVQESMAEFNRRYFADQNNYFSAREVNEKLLNPDHIYFIPWGDKLHRDKVLPLGNVAVLKEISHSRVFRLVLPDGRQFILRSDPTTAVKRSIAALGDNRNVYPPAPTPNEMRKAYLKEVAGHRAEVMIISVDNDPAYLKPFHDIFRPVATYALSIELTGERQEIIIAWVQDNARRVYAIASGKAFPARAVLVHNREGDKLALVPVSYRTYKPDSGRRWVVTPIADLDPHKHDDRRALSGWIGWVWFKKAKSYLP